MNLKQRIPLLRWSASRLAFGARNITTTGQIGDGREAAAALVLESTLLDGPADCSYFRILGV
jgi:catechol O-methyltransferase